MVHTIDYAYTYTYARHEHNNQYKMNTYTSTYCHLLCIASLCTPPRSFSEGMLGLYDPVNNNINNCKFERCFDNDWNAAHNILLFSLD